MNVKKKNFGVGAFRKPCLDIATEMLRLQDSSVKVLVGTDRYSYIGDGCA